MAGHINQHYVPQFYFKLFTSGRNHVCTLFTDDGRFVPAAQIKGQCARDLFYGSVEIEKAFSQLEGQHAEALRALIDVAATGDATKFSEEHFGWLLQAVVFQRSRTLLEVEKESPAHKAMFLHAFFEFVRRTKPPEEAEMLLGAIQRGEVEIVENPVATVLRQIEVALENAALLADLGFVILRNHTDYPFIFSDSPAVFYNSDYRNVTDRGVLGYQTPGLQIFLPLTPRFQLMMFDPAVYAGRCLGGPCCEVNDRGDVSRLNALQMYHSRQAVYFADKTDAEYVRELRVAHKARIVKPESVFRVRKDLFVDGEAGVEIMQTFEPHLGYRLSLSFVECEPVARRDYVFHRRSPELVAEHRKLYPATHSD
jgi:hypothetical protein